MRICAGCPLESFSPVSHPSLKEAFSLQYVIYFLSSLQLNVNAKNGTAWLEILAYEFHLAFTSRLNHLGSHEVPPVIFAVENIVAKTLPFQFDAVCQGQDVNDPDLRMKWRGQVRDLRSRYKKEFIFNWNESILNSVSSLNTSTDIFQVLF